MLNIRPGPDGALWLTEAFANKIGRITTDGVIKEFAIPSHHLEPVSLTTGPDGALWFTLAGSSEIGRLTTTGQFSFYTIPEAMTVPVGIAAGPDGALWFSTSPNFFYFLALAFPGSNFMSSGGAPGAIWTLSTTGTFHKFTSPKFLSDVEFILPGPDGALWFTQNQIQKVGNAESLTNSTLGRITTEGAIETFASPTPTGGALGLVVGSDGAFYFTEPALTANKIGRMTTDGDFSEFPIPTAKAVPAGITLGPDGNIWFVESSIDVSKVGRLSIGCGIVVSRACAQPTGTGAEQRVAGRKRPFG